MGNDDIHQPQHYILYLFLWMVGCFGLGYTFQTNNLFKLLEYEKTEIIIGVWAMFYVGVYIGIMIYKELDLNHYRFEINVQNCAKYLIIKLFLLMLLILTYQFLDIIYFKEILALAFVCVANCAIGLGCVMVGLSMVLDMSNFNDHYQFKQHFLKKKRFWIPLKVYTWQLLNHIEQAEKIEVSVLIESEVYKIKKTNDYNHKTKRALDKVYVIDHYRCIDFELFREAKKFKNKALKDFEVVEVIDIDHCDPAQFNFHIVEDMIEE